MHPKRLTAETNNSVSQNKRFCRAHFINFSNLTVDFLKLCSKFHAIHNNKLASANKHHPRATLEMLCH